MRKAGTRPALLRSARPRITRLLRLTGVGETGTRRTLRIAGPWPAGSRQALRLTGTREAWHRPAGLLRLAGARKTSAALGGRRLVVVVQMRYIFPFWRVKRFLAHFSPPICLCRGHRNSRAMPPANPCCCQRLAPAGDSHDRRNGTRSRRTV